MDAMSSASPAPHAPNKIHHNFDGDVKILNSTFDSRMEIRKALSNLQQVLQRNEGEKAQIVADVKFRIGGPDAKEHTYTVTVNDSMWDAEAFERKVSSARKEGSVGSGARVGAGSSPPAAYANGQRRPSARSESRAFEEGDDDFIEVRPAKKARIEVDEGPSYTSPYKETEALLREALALLQQRNSDNAFDFLKQWHTEWVKQGGWLFDTLNKAEKSGERNQAALLSRFGNVQDVLGQSMNAASASTMAELANISKLVPWLEHCRKSAADKVQAREEKWRSSSATFHDQARRDRETSEKKLELELQKQRALLMRIAEANGIDVEEVEEKDEERGGREASLGAQLTAELNMEASRGGGARKTLEERRREAINIEDDDNEK